jgi:hypothetical protein
VLQQVADRKDAEPAVERRALFTDAFDIADVGIRRDLHGGALPYNLFVFILTQSPWKVKRDFVNARNSFFEGDRDFFVLIGAKKTGIMGDRTISFIRRCLFLP